VRLDGAREGVVESGNGFDDATPDSSAPDRPEKPFGGVEPGGGPRGEAEGRSWMIIIPHLPGFKGRPGWSDRKLEFGS